MPLKKNAYGQYLENMLSENIKLKYQVKITLIFSRKHF